VNLAAASDAPGVKFTAPAGALAGATTVAITKVASTSSSYTPPAGATGLFMVGSSIYQITATSGSSVVTNFGKPVTLTFTYTTAQIPAGVAETNLKIYYYNATTRAWVEVASTVNAITHTITATVDHLTQFAIYGKKTASGASATIAQLQTLLNSLIAQIKVAVKAMIAQGKPVPAALMIYAQDIGSSSLTQAITSAGKITRGWALGQTGEEVKIIQTILAKDKAIYPEGKITGYFDAATLAAVQKFQVKYGIAKPGIAGYGYVGPLTRAKMNAM
jgi:hypothetical protein